MILKDNLWKVLLIVVFPLFLNRFVSTIYNLLDQLMVSEIGDTSVSAVTIINQIKNFLSCIGNGIAAGSGIYISRKYGEKNIDEAKEITSLSFLIQLISCGIILLLIPFSSLILKSSGITPELLSKATLYFIIQLFELILIAINDFFYMTERVKGQAKNILYLNFISIGLKTGLNALFIYVFKVDSIVYVEIASILAQSLITLYAFYKLFNKKNLFKISFKNLKIKKIHINNIVKFSLPLIFSRSIIDLGKIIFNSICSTFGALCVGALGVSNTLTGLATNPTEAVKDAESSIISTNLGNKNVKRSFQTFKYCLIVSLIWNALSLLFIKDLFLDQIINLFKGENTSEQFLFTIKEIFSYDWVTIPSIILSNVCVGVLLGYGKTFVATILNAVRIATRIGTVLICKTFFSELGQKSIGISTSISNIMMMVVSISILIIFVVFLHKKGEFKKGTN